MRILVVDDDRAVRESLRRSLSFNGYTVDLAQDGLEALEAIKGTPQPVRIVEEPAEAFDLAAAWALLGPLLEPMPWPRSWWCW